MGDRVFTPEDIAKVLLQNHCLFQEDVASGQHHAAIESHGLFLKCARVSEFECFFTHDAVCRRASWRAPLLSLIDTS